VTRRALIEAVLFAAAARADDSDILAIFAPLASALSDGDAVAFMRPIDKSMADRDKLSDNVNALLAGSNVTSSVELVRVDGDKVELDWSMQIITKGAVGVTTQRQQTVTARIDSKKRILEIGPIEFFGPTVR
jgi:hypothetical protein